MIITYNKLVRDKIPQIIEEAGKSCVYKVEEDNDAVIKLLEEKMVEEWQEYRQGKSLQGIADMIDVLHALAKRLGADKEEIHKLSQAKLEKRGGFEQGIFLVSVNG